MTFNDILNENARTGGTLAEKKFVSSLKPINGSTGKLATIPNSKTNIAVQFKWSGKAEPIIAKQAEILTTLKIDNVKDVKDVKVSIKMDKTDFGKHDVLISKPCSIPTEVKKGETKDFEFLPGDDIEVKKVGSFGAKVLYAETFKFSSKETIDYYKQLEKQLPNVTLGFESIVERIVEKLNEVKEKKPNVDLPKYVAKGIGTKTGNLWRWKIIPISKDAFWNDIVIQNVPYSGVPRVSLFFESERQRAKKVNESVNDILGNMILEFKQTNPVSLKDKKVAIQTKNKTEIQVTIKCELFFKNIIRVK